MKSAVSSIILSVLYFSITLEAFCQHQNILISASPDIEEPSIMINPRNPAEIIAGANLDYSFFSSDTGRTWAEKKMYSTYGVWGDPVMVIDNKGGFYYFHLSNPDTGNWIDRIVCQKTDHSFSSWSNGSYMGLNGTKVQDKEWVTIDRKTGILYATWTQFDVYADLFPSQPTDSTTILFSKSEDDGISWSAPKRINKIAGDCHDDDNAVEGAVPCVGPNGEIYVCWAGPQGLRFDKSTDKGNTWLKDDVLISDIPGGWNYNVPGIYRCNGLPAIACDTSNGAFRGRIYVNWSDQRNGLFDTDIWLSWSDDQGKTWCAPKRVNDDNPGKQQFFSWMAVDGVTGFIWIVFYDRREYSGNRTGVYLAVSKDGGNTFTNGRISETPFDPFETVFFGDYTNISVHNNIVRPIWTRLDNDKLSVWTALVNPAKVGINENEIVSEILLESNYPNPFSGSTWFSFKLFKPSFVNLTIMDMIGNDVAVLYKDDFLSAGKYICHFEPEKYNLKPGIYYFKLNSGNKNLVRKMVYFR